MTRVAGSSGEVTEKAVRRAAVLVIARHGYEAASLRMIAEEAGIKAPSLYNYIKSKEQLLYDLLKEPLVSMIDEFKERSSGVSDPYERLRLFIEGHLGFHLDFTREVFIGNMELRNLKKPHFKTVTGLRDQYSKMLTDIIEDGAAAGRFHVEDARVTTFALLAMLSGVCNWYRPDGPSDKETLVRIHTALAMQMLGVQVEDDTALSVPRPGRTKTGQRTQAA